MNAADIAAYVGAAAWIPQITGWVYTRYVKSELTLLADHQIAIGYAMIGGGVELRIALAAENKDAIIDSISTKIHHEDGEVHDLRWTRVSETFSEITDPSGARSVISRDTVVAFKVGTDAVVEKFITFGDARLDERVRPKIIELLEHHNFLQQQHQDEPNRLQAVLASRQFKELVEVHRESFWWKPGKYTLRFTATSPRPLKYSGETYTFELSRIEVDTLKLNTTLIERAFKNAVLSERADYQPEPVNWNVRTVPLKKLAG